MKCIILQLLLSVCFVYIFKKASGSDFRGDEGPEVIEKQDSSTLEVGRNHLDGLIAEYKERIPETLTHGPISEKFFSIIPAIFYQLYDQISKNPSILTNTNCSELAAAIIQTHTILKPFARPFSPLPSTSELKDSNKHGEDPIASINDFYLSAKNKYSDLVVFAYNLTNTPEFKFNTSPELFKKLEEIASADNPVSPQP